MKTRKTRNGMTLVAFGAALMLLTVMVMPAMAAGLSSAGKSVAENEAVWGKPVVIQIMDNGMEKRFYKYNCSIVGAYRSFTYKDGRAMDDGNTEATAPEPEPAQPKYRVVGSK